MGPVLKGGPQLGTSAPTQSKLNRQMQLRQDPSRLIPTPGVRSTGLEDIIFIGKVASLASYLPPRQTATNLVASDDSPGLPFLWSSVCAQWLCWALSGASGASSFPPRFPRGPCACKSASARPPASALASASSSCDCIGPSVTSMIDFIY
uniref:Uncharacterized protein n=1 Tax=Molossus molossus TaxID=27622 RepID=A0A7J8DBV1_MOLMO|nr:hypothetical protein HJG59_009350 [Molossus molossus]